MGQGGKRGVKDAEEGRWKEFCESVRATPEIGVGKESGALLTTHRLQEGDPKMY